MAAIAAHHGLVFIGFMGAGKTRSAQAVADRLGLGVIDTDDLLEGELGEPIETFFEREGEQEFRRREERLVVSMLDALAAQVGGPSSVVSLGGGAVERVAVQRALAQHLPVWCDVDEEIAWDRVSGSGRPLAKDREEFSRLFATRRPTYEKLARAILPSEARIAAEEAAPWLAAMQSEPAVRMAWARVGRRLLSGVGGRGRGRPAGRCPRGPPGAPARAHLLRRRLGSPRAARPAAAAAGDDDRASRGPSHPRRSRRPSMFCGELAEAGARRDDCVLAFGGGVVGDLAGFCAATYQRGIPLVQAPTTLVAQVDSAYGGKTGVDLPQAKNYVGAYHQPIAVLADPSVLATLPGEEVAAGFVEVLKTGLIAGDPLWERVRGIESLDPAALGEVIFECARAKIAVVAEDERDSGRRAVLNLGHTVGHAIEAATGYSRYRHGEAVGLGLLAALRLSGADDLRTEVEGLLASHGLPVSLDPAISVDQVVEAMGRDKKRTADGIGFVLIERPGQPRWGESVEPDRVRAAVEELR